MTKRVLHRVRVLDERRLVGRPLSEVRAELDGLIAEYGADAYLEIDSGPNNYTIDVRWDEVEEVAVCDFRTLPRGRR